MTWHVRLFVHFVFLLSGATALVLQIAWTRKLSLVFGANYQAISIVLGSFMAGLALGSVLFGRMSTRIERPLRLYGILEAGVALFALLLPFLLGIVDSFYVGIAQNIDGTNFLLTSMRVALAFSVLVIPTFFMGGTLPVLTRCLVQRYGEFGVRVASLYGINTLGAVLGVIATGFYLLPRYGVWVTILVAVSVNVLIAAAAFFVDAKFYREFGQPETAPESKPAKSKGKKAGKTETAPAGSRPLRHPFALRMTFYGTAISGGCALALEVLWTRGISIASSTSVYSFAVMLAAFLIGISIGSWLHAILPLRRIHESLQFGVALILAGTSSAIVSQLIPRLPELSVTWNLALYGSTPFVGAKTSLLLAFAIMLVPCLFMGIAFPLAGQARALLQDGFGRSVGDTIGLNTFGAILGSLLAGFVLIPLTGLQTGMLITASIYVVYGAIVLLSMVVSLEGAKRWLTGGVALPVLVAGCLIPVVAKRWDIHLMGTFSHQHLSTYATESDEVDLRQEIDENALLYYKEGRGSTISVFENAGERTIVVNGKEVASDTRTDLQVELLLGHLPALLHPNPKSGLVIGLGAGITLGSVIAHQGLDRVVLAEIEPAVFDGAALFTDTHDDAIHDPRLQIYYEDGRNYLLTTGERFDLITADPIHPWAQGAAYLYTIEYFRLASERLNDGGIMCLWLPLYGLSTDDLRSIIGAFSANFEHNSLWLAAFDAVVIGSNSEIKVDLKRFSERMAAPKVKKQLALSGLESPLALLGEYCLDDAGVREFCRDSIINTDDNLYIEFSSPLSARTGGWFINVQILTRSPASPLQLLSPLPSGTSREEIGAKLAKIQTAKNKCLELMTLVSDGNPRDLWTAAETLHMHIEALPEYEPTKMLYAQAMSKIAVAMFAEGHIEEALSACQDARQYSPEDQGILRVLSEILISQGLYEQAIPYLETIIRLYPHQATARSYLGEVFASLGRPADAIRVLRKALEVNPNHVETARKLAWALINTPIQGNRDIEEGTKIALDACDLPGQRSLRANLLTVLALGQAKLGDFGSAGKTVSEALKLAKKFEQGELAALLEQYKREFAQERVPL